MDSFKTIGYSFQFSLLISQFLGEVYCYLYGFPQEVMSLRKHWYTFIVDSVETARTCSFGDKLLGHLVGNNFRSKERGKKNVREQS